MSLRLKKNIAISESGLLFNTHSGESFYVNETGMLIIELLNGNLNPERIASEIQGKFHSLDESVNEDIEAFLAEMQVLELLETTKDNNK